MKKYLISKRVSFAVYIGKFAMKIILFFIFILFSYNTYPQTYKPPVIPPYIPLSHAIAVDSGNIRIYYALNAEDISNPKTYDDFQRLEIGITLSKYYSSFVYTSDSLCTAWWKKQKGSGGGPFWLGDGGKNYEGWSEYHWSEYFKDFSENDFTEYTRMPMYLTRSNCQYSEDVHTQDWELFDDTLTIIGYLCQKAVCRFRGRDYTAWFALDIPISNGPWKFGGLPGLILKIYDNEKLWVFECTAIEEHKTKYPIKMFRFYNKFPKMERTKLLKFYKNIHDDYINTAGLIIEVFKQIPRPEKSYESLELE